jgi:hypothetical protein
MRKVTRFPYMDKRTPTRMSLREYSIGKRSSKLNHIIYILDTFGIYQMESWTFDVLCGLYKSQHDTMTVQHHRRPVFLLTIWGRIVATPCERWMKNEISSSRVIDIIVFVRLHFKVFRHRILASEQYFLTLEEVQLIRISTRLIRISTRTSQTELSFLDSSG